MRYQLIINFDELDDLKAFIEDQETIELIKQKKLFKKQNTSDKRGHQTKNLHQKAKEYQNANPSLSYKEALQIVGKQVRTASKALLKVYPEDAESQQDEGKTTIEEDDDTPDILIGRIIEKIKNK